jgi:hypothetical protein
MPSDPYRDSQALPRQTPCRTAWMPGRLLQASTSYTKAQTGRSSSGQVVQETVTYPLLGIAFTFFIALFKPHNDWANY